MYMHPCGSRIVRSRSVLALAAVAGIGAAVACGSGDDGNRSDNQSSLGGSSHQVTGGASNSSTDGEGGVGKGGTTTELGGAAGAANVLGGQAGSGGIQNNGTAGASILAGSSGVAGSAPEYWQDGTKGPALDPNYDDRLWGVAFGPNGEVYATGYVATVTGDRQMVVARYNLKAELDQTFGASGLAIINTSSFAGLPDDPATAATDADPSIEEGRDLVVQSDGKIVVVGRAENPTDPVPSRSTLADLVFFRLNTDGSRDLSFGDPVFDGTALDGLAVVSFGNTPEDQVWGLDIDAFDRVYAFGSGLASDLARTDSDRYVVRLTANGTVDTTFGVAGIATFDTPQGSLTGTAPVTLKLNDNPRHGFVLPDGSVVSAGYTNVAGRNQVVVAKFDSTGKLDSTFSGDGVARVAPFANGIAEAYGIAVQYEAGQPTGFVTTGYGRVDADSTTDTDVDMVSFRFKANGEFDTAWGVGGAVVYDLSGAEDRGRYAFALPDNRIVMLGTGVATGSNKDAMIVLLERNGAVAKDFDSTGHKLYDFGGTNDEFYAAALSKDGAWIAAVGYAGASTAGLANGNSTVLLLPVGK